MSYIQGCCILPGDTLSVSLQKDAKVVAVAKYGDGLRFWLIVTPNAHVPQIVRMFRSYSEGSPLVGERSMPDDPGDYCGFGVVGGVAHLLFEVTRLHNKTEDPETEKQKEEKPPVEDTKEIKPNYAPDYCAALYPALSSLFIKHGYALAVHGSLARDFDLIAMPWCEQVADPPVVIQAMVKEFALKVVGPPIRRARGRLVYTLSVGFGECACDLSFV